MRIRAFFATLIFVVLSGVGTVLASDHADPIFNKKVGAGITGLFFFPDPATESMVAILNVVPGLTESPQGANARLSRYTYRLHMDLTTAINFDDEAQMLRFGASIPQPEKIHPDVTIELRLNDDATLADQPKVEGLQNPADIQFFSGLRDDPFIFPRFFGTNVVSMVMRIPKASFPAGQQQWLVWATTHKGSKQIDHVGRSNRTMQPRLDFLNTLPPHEHVPEIQERHDDPGLFWGLVMRELEPLFAIRHYDIFPDVLIYSALRPLGFPNGRRLTDDVAKLTCEYGDCLLWELSYADEICWPRRTTNDKPFSATFPYLAEPWPIGHQPPTTCPIP